MKATRRLFIALLVFGIAAFAFGDDDSGLLIGGIVDDSPAEKAGLMRGDILLEFDGKEVDSAFDLTDLLSDYRAGQRVSLKILRGGTEKTVSLTLEDRLNRPILGIELTGGARGMTFGGRSFDGMPFSNLRTERFGMGVIILEVADGSPADTAGLQPRDAIISIDGEHVPPYEFKEIIESHEPGDRIKLEISRPGDDGDEPIEVTVRLGENDDGGALLGVQFAGGGMPHGADMREHFENMGRGFRDRMPDRGRQFDWIVPRRDEDRSDL